MEKTKGFANRHSAQRQLASVEYRRMGTKMLRKITLITLIFITALLVVPHTHAQSEGAEQRDRSSEEVEQSEDSYRRQMELEDARDRESGYADVTYSDQAEKEKIDKLPKESQENIKDHMRDIIMEGGPGRQLAGDGSRVHFDGEPDETACEGGQAC